MASEIASKPGNISLYIRLIILFSWLVQGTLANEIPKELKNKSFAGVQGAVLQKSPLVYASGYQYFRNYSKNDYNHHPQNWCITQDAAGLLFVGNLGGVLEYDGVSWRLIEIPNLLARALTIDPAGTIYIGGKNELGFLAPGDQGNLRYVSLLNHMDETSRDFGSIFQAFTAPDGIYFRAAKILLRWDGQTFKTWTSSTGFSGAFVLEGKIYIQQKKTGLHVLENDSLADIPGGSFFSDDAKKINMAVPFDHQGNTGKTGKIILIGTRAAGLYLYDAGQVTPFPTGADERLTREKNLLHGIGLHGGEFALATDGGGVIIIDRSGKIKQCLDKSTGLMDDNVKYLYQEQGGNLWLALNNGICKIEIESPFTIFDDHCQLPGTVLTMVKQENTGCYYIGTNEGLYTLLPGGTCQPVAAVSGTCWSLVWWGDLLLAATDNGIFTLKNNHPITIDARKYNCLLVSRHTPHRVWGGFDGGLAALNNNGVTGEWNSTIINVNGNVQSIVEEPGGALWLGTPAQGVFYISFPLDSEPVITHWGADDGLPGEKDQTMGEIHVAYIANHTVLATQHGLYQFDPATGRFVLDRLLGKDWTGEKNFADGSEPVFRIGEDGKGNIWFHSRSRNYVALRQPDDSYRVENKWLRRIPQVQVNSIFMETGAVWFCTYEGLIKYNTDFNVKGSHSFNVFIRGVEDMGNKRIIFAGHGLEKKAKQGPGHSLEEALDDEQRNLRFFFAAPFYQDEQSTVYSYFLKGYDQGWSDWSSETRKDYTNLNGGNYTFFIKAKNVYGETTLTADSFSFKIEPPWYGTVWAYILYMLVAGVVFYGGVKYRSRHLEKEKKRLESIVEHRTHEVREKNLQLEKQTEILRLQSGQLQEMDKIKSRFFANISHEFRTPLTLIMGPLEQIICNPAADNELKNKALLMMRNSQRLLGLINQLLDLSCLHSGKMRLQVMRKNIIPFIRGIMASFQLLAEQRQVDLSFSTQHEDMTLYFNSGQMEQILCNLIVNAIKNTRAGGVITISTTSVNSNTDSISEPITAITGKEKTGKTFPEGFLEISVKDTGVGIPADQLQHIFELFYQVQTQYETKVKGSGIGLALTRELVELHGGGISVQSTEGEGTEFKVLLPLGKSHLKPGEIIDVTQSSLPSSLPESALETYKPGIKEWELVVSGPVEALAHVAGQATDPVAREEQPLILVVDDHADFRGYLGSVFASSYRVIEAPDGKEGLAMALESIPDIIIADVMMPHMDGFELTRRLKEERRTCHIPLILLTARTSHQCMLEGLQIGADDYIAKPFNVEILVARVKNLIDLRRQLQERMKNQMALVPYEMSVSPMDEEFYTELRQVIEKNISDSRFSVEGLAALLYMGRTTVYRKILALTGETPNQFIRTYRLRRAVQLLNARAGTISEIAAMVGFANSSYFTHCFKEKFHYLPSDMTGESGGDAHQLDAPTVLAPETPVTGEESEKNVIHDPGIILLVEDNADVCDYIGEALAGHYQVEIAGDGPQGFESAQTIIPDLIISDIMMPGFDGYELCRRLKSNVSTSHIPVVFLTAKASENSIIQGLEMGVDDYITKPFNADILLARVQGILALRAHLQATRKRQLNMEPDKIVISSMDEKFLGEVNQCIEKNLADFDFNVEVLAEKLSIGRTTLYRKVLALTGENPTHYIRSFRLNKAARMLKELKSLKSLNTPAPMNKSITDVAFAVGFSSTPYFTRCFKEMFHRLPSSFSDAEQ